MKQRHTVVFDVIVGLLFAAPAVFASPPVNDDYSNRTFLPSLTDIHLIASNNFATTEPNDGTTDAVWWSYTPPVSGLLWLEVSSASFQSTISGYSGTNRNDLTFRGTATGLTNVTRLRFAVEAGTPYQIAVSKMSGVNGVFELRLGLGSIPDDRFENRNVLTGSSNFVAVPDLFWSGWWTWVPPTSGLARITLEPVSSGYFVTYTNAPPDPGVNFGNPTLLQVEQGRAYHFHVSTLASQGRSSFSAYIIPRPPNDDFTNRTVLYGDYTKVIGTGSESTVEPGEFLRYKGSVWYTWTAPSHGVLSLRVQPRSSTFKYDAGLHGDPSLPNTSLFTLASGCCGSPAQGMIPVTSGRNYNFLVDTGPGSDTEFELTLELTRDRLNDAFADALPFPALTNVVGSNSLWAASTTGHNRAATEESGENLDFGFGIFAIGRTVWWSWTPTFSGTATLLARGNGFQPVVGAFTGTSVANLVRRNVLVSLAGNTARVSWNAISGQRYLIAVDSTILTPVSTSGDFVLELFEQVAVPSDYFSNQVALAGTTITVTGSLASASTEVGEPVHANGAFRSIWWTWTAPTDGFVSVSQTDLSANAISSGLVSAVYTGNSLGALVLVSKTVSTVTNPARTHVTFFAQAGTTYKIATASTALNGPVRLQVNYSRPPAVAWVSPVANAAYPSSSDVVLEATATDPDGDNTIAQVDFYDAGQLVATCLSPPYQTVLTNIATGLHILRLEAIDSHGLSASTDITIKASAPNDSFAARELISGFPAVVYGTNGGATLEANEPNHAGQGINGSLWWDWTAPSDGLYTIGFGGRGPSALAVYRGVNLTNLELVTSKYFLNSGNSVSFAGSSGQTYTIALAVTNPGPFVLRIMPPPANDFFTNRALAVGEEWEVDVMTYGATLESGEPGAANSSATLWWSWTPPVTSNYRVSSQTFYPNSLVVDAYTGTSISNLTAVRLEPALAGTNYQLRIRASNGDTEGRVRFERWPFPANDSFVARAMLSVDGGSVATSSFGATKEPNEPSHPNNGGGRSLWWSWRPEARGLASLVYSNDFSSVIAIYRGTGLENLLRLAHSTNGAAGGALSGRIEFWVEDNVEYLIAVDGWNGAAGNVSFDLSLQAQPSNDLFGNAHILPGFTNRVRSFNGDATKETGEPNHAGVSGGKSLWWLWVPSTTRSVSLSTTGTLFGVAVAAYTGDHVDALTPITSATSTSGNALLTFVAQEGIPYRIAIDSLGAPAGEVNFNLLPNDPPIVTILTPENGALLPYGVGVNIQVETSDDQTPVSQVEIRSGPTSFAIMTAPPFTLNRVIAPGIHTLRAIARDQVGSLSTSAPVTFRVVTAGDDFSRRQTLTGLPALSRGTTAFATNEPGEPWHGGLSPFRSVWWEWTAPMTGRICVSTPDSSFETRLAIYQGETLETLTPIASARGRFADAPNSRLLLDVVAGAKYVIALDGLDAGSGAFGLMLEEVPGSDDFRSASTIAGVGSWSASNTAASREPNEPIHAGVLGGRTVWWQWVAPSNGNYFAQTEGSSFNTILAVYEGISSEELHPVVANDDFEGSAQSRVTFSARTDHSYLFAVDGVSAASGDIRLTIGVLDYPHVTLLELLPNELRIELRGEPGRSYQIEVSDDLVVWSPLRIETAIHQSVEFSVSRTPTGSARFVRAVQLP